ncbi:MAG: hypothetical protein JWP01_649 [Myxococcales bacterium]|nr:hypothetical protein [Myxococcales bacterium]
MTKTRCPLLIGSVALLALSACGKKSDPLSSLSNHAIGTYIGGGSMLGTDSCTYSGTPSVFQSDDGKPSSEPAKGPRFVFAAGTITKDCAGEKSTVKAVVPTGAKIVGPSNVTAGAKSDLFTAYLVSDGSELGGEASIDWKLGHDCDGLAAFGPVMGAQDTGGKDRSRTLEAKAKGTCTVIVGLTTGTALNESFKPQAFQAEMLVTIK